MGENARLARLVEVLRERRAQPGESVEKQRSAMEAAVANSPMADGVTARRISAGGGEGEWLEPAETAGDRTILHLHGGGYVIGSVNTVRSMASQLARAAGARVLTLDYRLAPEHPFPAAVEDSLTAYRWLLEEGVDPADLAISGDSAGGGLALATVVALRDGGEPLPAAVVCLSPWTDLTLSAPSLELNADSDPQVSRWGLEAMATHYLAGQDPAHPLASPLFADLGGLPPLLVHAGAAEGLRDDALRLAEAATAAGVDVTMECWEDMIHVWHAFAPGLPEGTAAIDRVGEWLRQRLAVSGRPGNRTG